MLDAWGGLDTTIDGLNAERKAKRPAWESPEDKAARRHEEERLGTHIYHPDTQRRLNNKALKMQLRAAHGDDEQGFEDAYRSQKQHYNGEKGTTKATTKIADRQIEERNAELKRRLKHQGSPDYKDRYEQQRERTSKELAEEEKASTKAGLVGTAASSTTTPAMLGGHAYAHQAGGSSSGGSSISVPGASAVAPVMGLLGTGASTLQNWQDMEAAENDVQRKTAKRNFKEGLADTGTAALKTAGRALDVAEATGLDAVGEVAPGLGMGISTVNFIRGAKAARSTTRRIDKSKKVAKSAGDPADLADVGVHLAAKSLRKREKQQRANAIAQTSGSAVSMAGNALSLTGIGAIAGAPIAAGGMAIRQGGNLGNAVENQRDAKAGRKARRMFADAREADASGESDSFGALGKGGLMRDVLMHNPDVAVQHLIQRARDGDATAQRYLDVYKIDAKRLSEASDEDIRKDILDKAGASEDAQTWGTAIKGTGGKVRDLRRQMK